MAKPPDVGWFDYVSDDILLYILRFVPKQYWSNLMRVNQRFKNVCMDKDMFRFANFSSAYGLTDSVLQDYLRTGGKFVKTLNLNHCYWISASTLSNLISRCPNIQHLHVLDCKLTTNGFSKIMCSLECLKTLVISVTNLVEFSNEINSNTDVQNSLANLQHFGIHIREESSRNSSPQFQFHLSQQTTIIEYCPDLESFSVIGQPDLNTRIHSKRLIYPLLVKTQNMSKMKSMSINGTNDATSRLYFYGILVKAFEASVQFLNLSVSGLDLKQAVKKFYFTRALNQSIPTLEMLDLSKVLIDEFEKSVNIEGARCLKYLNLSDVRSESSSVGLMNIASKCPTLVSLNLRGATSGHRYWGTVELGMLDEVLKVCPNLKNINLSGVHVHGKEESTQLLPVLFNNSLKGLKSIAFPVCAMASGVKEASTKKDKFLSKGFGAKRQRVSKQPSASTSADMSETGLYRLSQACPNITAIEIINSNFNQSVVLPQTAGGHKPLYDPCNDSYQVTNNDLIPLANFTELRYLQITGVPGLSSGKTLQEIGERCPHIERLSLAYLGLGTPIPHVWDNIQYFKQLRHLRLEQPSMKLDSRLYQSIFKCSKLQRLTIVSKNSKLLDIKTLENCIQQASNLYVIQLFTDTTLKECDRLRSNLQKRFEVERPGFLATVEQLLHERVVDVLGSLPLKHLEEMTLLTSRVCSSPRHVVGEGEPNLD